MHAVSRVYVITVRLSAAEHRSLTIATRTEDCVLSQVVRRLIATTLDPAIPTVASPADEEITPMPATPHVSVTPLEGGFLHVEPPHVAVDRLAAVGWHCTLPERDEAYRLWSDDGGDLAVDHLDRVRVDDAHCGTVLAILTALAA